MLSACILFFGCKQSTNHPPYTDRQRLMLDTTNNHTHNIDSLRKVVLHHKKSGNRMKEMAAYAELGHCFQTLSRYSDAILVHQKQLKMAREVADTLMIASALNDLGVNCRRMGLYYEALDYHSRAIEICANKNEEDKERLDKCEAIGHNGVGNVYMSIGHYKEADVMLRKALAIETKLGSNLGMNVNYSNIGMLYERREMPDSAWIYFRKAFEHSRKAKSKTGLAYCHMNFGRMYQKEKKYEKAIKEFNKSMNLIHQDRDRWIWLQPCISMAGLHVETNNHKEAEKYLSMALKTADKINSKEYLSKIYSLYSTLYSNQGNYPKALEMHTIAHKTEDSLLNAKTLFEIERLQYDITHWQNKRIIAETNRELSLERLTKWLFVAGFLIMLASLTILWLLTRIRQRNVQMQKNFENMRDRFFNNITHAFRTPLTVILGEGEEMTKAQETDLAKQHAAGKMILRQGHSLLLLLNQLLDISKVKSSVEEPDWRTGNVVSFLNMVIEECQQLVKTKHITMSFMPKEPEIIADIIPGYLHQIICTLITNATKYTDEYGNIRIVCHTKDSKLEIIVADDGIGIPSETLEHLFEPFHQAYNSSSSITSEAGMYLVKMLATAMKGEVTVESIPRKGTIFILSLPLKNSKGKWKPLDDDIREKTKKNIPDFTENETTAFPPDSEPKDDLQTRILIIEDNADVAHYISRQLPEQYHLFYAANGIDGLRKANELMPDIVLTDLMIPGIDGLELCRKIRSSESTNTIPVIIIAARATQEDLETGLKAGANAYLFMPFSGNELRIRIEWILTERRMLREKYLLVSQEMNEINPRISQKDREFITQFTNAIYEQIQEVNIDPDLLAQKLYMNKQMLRRKISNITHTTLPNYISKIRVDYAKQLLKRYPELSINDVSIRCGFCDHAYFSRTFKQIIGVSPTQYRKNLEII